MSLKPVFPSAIVVLPQSADRAGRRPARRSSRASSICSAKGPRTRKIAPLGKIPVLRDEAKNLTIPETSIIIEYLAQHYPGRTQLFPADRDLCRQMRLCDRIYDLYVNVPMQNIVADRLRPADNKDPFGVDQARAMLEDSAGHDRTGHGGRPLGRGR